MLNKKCLWLGFSLCVTWGIGTSGGLWAQEATSPAPSVKNVIVMVADGYGPGALALYREWNQLKALPIDDTPYVGMMYTNSSSDYVTDSASAATAMATGVSTNNEAIGLDPHGNAIVTLSEAFKQQGKAVGLVSTNAITDATPAGFGAHVKNRWDQDLIPLQYLEQSYDVILGGGRNKWLPTTTGGTRADGKDVIAWARTKGYTYVENKSELAQVKGDKLLGLFHESHMSYKSDRQTGCGAEHSQEPTLKEMTLKALEVLSKNPKGFFLMSEGARIDHAGHALDVPAMMLEIAEYYDALEAVHAWVKDHPDTLVVVVSDHDTMGISASQLTQYKAFAAVRCSTEHYMTHLPKEKNGTYDRVALVKMLENIGVSAPRPDEIDLVVKGTQMKHAHLAAVALGQVVTRRLGVGSHDAFVNWDTKTGGHSSMTIPIFARGARAEVFSGVYPNTEIAKRIANVTGIPNIGTLILSSGDIPLNIATK